MRQDFSEYSKEKLEILKAKATQYYRLGLSTREVAKLVGRSHAWVARAVQTIEKKEQELETKFDKKI